MVQDDELEQLLHRVRKANTPKYRLDPVMELTKATSVVLTDQEIAASDFVTENRCSANARRANAIAGGPYGIDVVVPEMIACCRRKGHEGAHLTAPAVWWRKPGLMNRIIIPSISRNRKASRW